jgi:hypothetical protein
VFGASPECVIFVAYYSYEGVLIALSTYSRECVEDKFSEVRIQHAVFRAVFAFYSTP